MNAFFSYAFLCIRFLYLIVIKHIKLNYVKQKIAKKMFIIGAGVFRYANWLSVAPWDVQSAARRDLFPGMLNVWRQIFWVKVKLYFRKLFGLFAG